MTPEQVAALNQRLLALELALDRRSLNEHCPTRRTTNKRKWRHPAPRVTLKGVVECRL
jgi:hypothetical protein